MKIVIPAIALAAVLGAACSGGGQPARNGAGSTHTVVMEGTGFRPADLKIKAGDTVVWENKDPFPHTATSNDGGFDSKDIASGSSWTHTFQTTGRFPYVCSLHPTMKGTLSVE